jgi:hypothetical protein
MAVDTERVQVVFQAAVRAGDPAERAAILDRECASDAEMRQRVEALLRRDEQTEVVHDEAAGPPPETPPLPPDGTVVLPPPAAPAGPAQALTLQDPVAAHEGPQEDKSQEPLEFLQPSTKPGSLGRLGHYEVLEVLGRGGFGIVVRAFDEVLQRVVAIKVMSPQLASTSPARKRFLREARASARVRHENVVQIYGVEEQPLPYLVMEYIPGQTLQEKLDQSGPLEVPDVLRIGGQVARGLAAAHEQGLVHRDIKPANILLESAIVPKVKITDFGLARAADDASLSQSGVIAGTPLYMAPEQANGEPLDHRADLFSLGSVLYTIASGRPPFRAGTTTAVLRRVAEDTPRPIRQIIPEVPQWLCDVIARLHAKSPAQRFQSAAEVAALLEQYLAHPQQPSLVARPGTAEVPAPRKSRRGALLAAGAVLLAVLAGGLTYPLWRPAGPPPESETPGDGGGQAQAPPAAPPGPPAGELRTCTVQGPAAVRAALIDFSEPERNFGAAPQDNPVRRADQCDAFLVRFDLAKAGLAPQARLVKAAVSFYVWDPSSSGKTKVCAFRLKTAWDPATVTWRKPAEGKVWQGGAGFAFDVDTGPAGPGVVVLPDQPGTDTADPPIEYQLDVTDAVRAWLEGGAPNHGLAIAPVIDPAVDEGFSSRFQVYGTAHGRPQYTPKLTLQVRQ